MQPSHALVIGVGNRYRGDDAAGLAVAQRIRKKAEKVTVLELPGIEPSLHESWSEKESVILIDAVSSGASPGTIFTFDARKVPLPASMFHCSTHSFGIPEVIELARMLKKLPTSLFVYGIEGADFHPGEGLSPHVQTAVDLLTEMVLNDLRRIANKEQNYAHA